ncbi:MAG: tetratricopeptide repeat protein [Bacteroidia bacterium]|nr:tetratricopeptide repeat protein [Bacteroidia bacterium]MDW8159724.1 tetratricopeptide repeat protein [Bacteroidia bacterium]
MVFAQKGPGYQKYNQARQKQREKKYEEAIKLYDEAISLEKTQYKYYLGKGLCLSKLDPPKLDEAIQAYTECLKVNPGYSKAYVYIAQIYIKKNDIDKAIENYNLAYEKEQDLSQKIAYKIQAINLLSKLEKHDQAMKELQTLKNIAGDDLRVMALEGSVYGANNQWEQSLDAYQKAVKKATAVPMTPAEIAKYKVGEGLAYYRLGKMKEYETILAELKTTSPKHYRLLQKQAKGAGATKQIRLAMAYFKAEEYDEALKYINQAIEKKENLNTSYYIAGMILSKQGKTTQAVTQFTQAAQEEKDPKKLSKIYNTLIRLQFQGNMYNEAINTANNILSKNPNDYSVIFLKGLAEYKAGKYAEALSSYDKALGALGEKGRADLKAKYNFCIGLAAKKAGSKDKAIAAFKNAKTAGAFKVAADEELKMLTSK